MVGVGVGLVLILLLMLAKQGSSATSFSFHSFNDSTAIELERDAYPSNGTLHMARERFNQSLSWKYGRASSRNPVQLWDRRKRELADFATHFTFSIQWLQEEPAGADGITFFLAPFGSTIANASGGGNLGLFPRRDGPDSKNDTKFIAVEFDTFRNDLDSSDQHVGIDINSIVLEVSVPWTHGSMKDGRMANAWVTYDSASWNLSVFLTYDEEPVFRERYRVLSYKLDLRDHLPENVRVGFTAATGVFPQAHTVFSWSFNSTLVESEKQKSRFGLIIGLALGICALGTCGIGLLWFIWRERRAKEEDYSIDAALGETGQKRFTYQELRRATNGFPDERKLGEGVFGAVYRGFLSELSTEVAVKRISQGSRQGKKEYISEVRIISLLRHRNLVQLIGWCHTKSEFLLVYEFLPNGSLDAHLFGNKPTLSWTVRYKIAHGLASALLYLHEEGEQFVVHRDIKSSNIMLDSNFTAKLGDFGLARYANHESSLQTTVLAGTRGYMALEYVITGKASKASDVYSFGVVALEICCGRRPIEHNVEPSRVSLVEWAWDLYGQGRILEAADTRLRMQFDVEQMESLMVMGLWCCHPDPANRPSIKDAVSVLNFQAPLPNLPSELPRPVYFAPSDVTNPLTVVTDGTQISEGR